jgi:hypothetical protein
VKFKRQFLRYAYLSNNTEILDSILSTRGSAPVHNRAGWRRGDGLERQWLIPPETWKAEVVVGHDPILVARVLADRGLLRRASDGYQCVERIEGRSQRVYVVSAKILSEPVND